MKRGEMKRFGKRRSFGKLLIWDQATIEYAERLRTLARMLGEDSLPLQAGGQQQQCRSSVGRVPARSTSATCMRTVRSRSTTPRQNSRLRTAGRGGGKQSAMERVALELWRRQIKTWLRDRPLMQRLNQHNSVKWTMGVLRANDEECTMVFFIAKCRAS
jgi:hypothetical protein